MSVTTCVYHDRAILGEGVFWSQRDQKVYWVDIDGERVCRFDPDTGENVSVIVGQQVGTVAERASGGLVAALKDGVYALDFTTGKLEKWCDPMEGDAENRLNDGKVGPDGRLYVGTIGPDEKQHLYCLERDGKSFRVLESGISCSNGMAWSADRKTMYYTDSYQRLIWAYDFDAESGAISNRRVVVDLTSEESFPDGFTIDCEGKLWVAHWGASCVRRYDPDTRKVLEEIFVPVSRVTSCAFGGENLDTLYITTASVGFEEADWEEEPEAGGLFSVKPGVQGVPNFLFEG